MCKVCCYLKLQEFSAGRVPGLMNGLDSVAYANHNSGRGFNIMNKAIKYSAYYIVIISEYNIG